MMLASLGKMPTTSARMPPGLMRRRGLGLQEDLPDCRRDHGVLVLKPAPVEAQVYRLARDRWQTRQNPRTFVQGEREIRWLRLIQSEEAKSYMNPMVYIVLTSPFT